MTTRLRSCDIYIFTKVCKMQVFNLVFDSQVLL